VSASIGVELYDLAGPEESSISMRDLHIHQAHLSSDSNCGFGTVNLKLEAQPVSWDLVHPTRPGGRPASDNCPLVSYILPGELKWPDK
jgi:hypothetical protein